MVEMRIEREEEESCFHSRVNHGTEVQAEIPIPLKSVLQLQETGAPSSDSDSESSSSSNSSSKSSQSSSDSDSDATITNEKLENEEKFHEESSNSSSESCNAGETEEEEEVNSTVTSKEYVDNEWAKEIDSRNRHAPGERIEISTKKYYPDRDPKNQLNSKAAYSLEKVKEEEEVATTSTTPTDSSTTTRNKAVSGFDNYFSKSTCSSSTTFTSTFRGVSTIEAGTNTFQFNRERVVASDIPSSTATTSTFVSAAQCLVRTTTPDHQEKFNQQRKVYSDLAKTCTNDTETHGSDLHHKDVQPDVIIKSNSFQNNSRNYSWPNDFIENFEIKNNNKNIKNTKRCVRFNFDNNSSESSIVKNGVSDISESESDLCSLRTTLENKFDNTYNSPEKRICSLTTPAMHQRISVDHHRLRPVLRKPGQVKKRGRSVTFNESLNLFYEAEGCSCWVHENDYNRMRAEEQHYEQLQRREDMFHFHETCPPIEFEDPGKRHLVWNDTDGPTLSPPEGYKDRFFPQDPHPDPDVTRCERGPPSPPQARRKVFLKEEKAGGATVNGLEEGREEGDEEDNKKNKGSSRLGGILKGGRLWRSNSADAKNDGKKVTTSPEEPDVVKCSATERDRVVSEREAFFLGTPQHPTQQQVLIVDDSAQHQFNQSQDSIDYSTATTFIPSNSTTKVSTGTAPLRTSEQIRLAVDSTLRLRQKKSKPETNSSLVEKLRWLTSLDDDDSDSSQSGFATWPSRDKNGSLLLTKKSADAGTSTEGEFQSATRQPPSINSANEAKIKQISYTLEDIEEGLKGTENELETFITEDGGRIERLRKRYTDEIADDYGFSRRPSVKGIKPKFSSTNQIFAQFTSLRKQQQQSETPVESQYENTRQNFDPTKQNSVIQNPLDGARILSYEFQIDAPGRQSEESRAHFEMIRQSFEQANFTTNFNRPHSWSVTLPHPHSSATTTGHYGHTHSHSLSMTSPSPIPPGANPNPIPSTTSGNMMNPVNNSGPVMQQHQHHQHSALVATSSSSLTTGPSSNNSAAPSPLNNSNNSNNHPGGVLVGTIGNNMPNNSQMMMFPTATIPASQTAVYGTISNSLPPHAQQIGNQVIIGTQQMPPQQLNVGQQIYGTVRRVPNVIGRPLFLHYGALSVEAHPNKIFHQPAPYPRPPVQPETPSPTQQVPPLRYYGPPIRYYNPPPPVPPRSVTTSISTSGIPGENNSMMPECQERGVPEGATDETMKEPYSMFSN